jgi:hypothetical protein
MYHGPTGCGGCAIYHVCSIYQDNSNNSEHKNVEIIPLPHHSRLDSGNPESTSAGSHFFIDDGCVSEPAIHTVIHVTENNNKINANDKKGEEGG